MYPMRIQTVLSLVLFLVKAQDPALDMNVSKGKNAPRNLRMLTKKEEEENSVLCWLENE